MGELKSHFGWQAYRLALVDEKGEIQAAFPYLKTLALYFRTYFVLRAARPGINRVVGSILETLICAITELAVRERAVFLRIDPEIPATDADKIALLKQVGFFPIKDSIQPVCTPIWTLV